MNNLLSTTEKTLSFNRVKVTSAAQAITLIAYGDCSNGEKAEIPFRNLDFKCRCEDYKDFEECIKLISDYNEFDAEEMLPYLQQFLGLRKYYYEGNANNGNSFFRFDIAREGSPAFYVSIHPDYDKFVITDNGNTPYSLNDFKKNMAILKKLISADEMDIEEGFTTTARFWFD
ncbi:MAG TPA: hypothetical protein VN698_00025 [Bacteroidia bacterium]|nr:hypothetical protein [Bacteroidia bacterium]